MAGRTEPTNPRRKWFRIVLLFCLGGGLCLAIGLCGYVLNNPWVIHSGEGIGLHEPQQSVKTAYRVPQWSPDGRVLIVNTGLRIWGVNLQDGSKYVIPKLKDDGQFSPSISATGHVAYANYEHRRDPMRVEIVSFDGGKSKRLSDRQSFPVQPVISPTGTHVAWIERTHESSDVMIATADGSDRTLIRKGGHRATRIDWSPDGSAVAIVWKINRFMTELELVSRSGTDRKTLATLDYENQPEWEYLSLPAWVPDGRLLFFMRERGFGADGNPTHPMKIMSVREDGSDLKLFLDLGTNFLLWPEALQLSSNGNQLAFVARANDSAHDQLYTLHVDGTDLKLIDSGHYDGVSWSPDGNMMAVHDKGFNSYGDQVFIVNPSTGEKTPVHWEK